MASIDLKSAFHTIPMDPEYTKFLKFQIDNITYRYNVLPMGFTDSPRLFCKILKPVLVFLRKQKLLSSLYIDDFYLQGDSYEDCAHNVKVTLLTLKKLGFEISEKSMLTPNTQLEHLGFVLNSESMSISLSENKREQIIQLIRSSLHSTSLTVRDVAKLVGTLIASFPAVEYGLLYHRELELLKINALKALIILTNLPSSTQLAFISSLGGLKKGFFQEMLFHMGMQTLLCKVTARALLGEL